MYMRVACNECGEEFKIDTEDGYGRECPYCPGELVEVE